MPVPSPRGVAAGEEESALRRFECRWYAECLNAAAKARWASWSCDTCRAYAANPKRELALRRASSLSFEGR
jgi:hypothetical protein